MTFQSTSPFVADAELPVDDPQIATRRMVRVALGTVGVLVFGLFGMAAVVPVAGAVIGYGEVSVDSSVKKVAHPSGGVIAALFVKDGDRVRAGQPLMRLDTTVSGVSAATSGEGLEQLLAARARLAAERDGLGTIAFPPALAASPAPTARDAIAEQTRLFALRRSARLGQKAQLGERVRQSQAEIGSLRVQLEAAHKQSALIEPEREGLRQLWDKRLVTLNRVNQLERTAVDLEGGAASLQAQIAQARARIAEIRQSSIQLDQDARSQAATELAEVEAKLNDQLVRKAAAGDTLDRSIVRAPGAGVIDKLAFTTVGGVVPATETIAEIVPDSDRVTVEAKINPADIDQLRVGQPAMLRFSALNLQTTPQIEGHLVRTAAQRTTDDRSGTSFYKVKLEVDPGQLRRLGGAKLVPGMPVEAYVQTGSRSLLSYLTKPLRDQLSRAFREN